MKIQHILTEAVDYSQMFNSVFALAEYLPSDGVNRGGKEFIVGQIPEHIYWAKQHLKKNDRIVWYLRTVKYSLLYDLARVTPHGNDEKSQQFQLSSMRELSDFSKRYPYTVEFMKKHGDRFFRQSILHFLSLPVPKIQSYVWDKQPLEEILDSFQQYEQEWQEKSGQRAVDIEEGDQLVLEFDGGNSGWWLLNRGACKKEADAMGHCGNVPSQRHGDRILSFRVKHESGKWTPQLTFILNGKGYLGEMKGRANEKPAKRYHPYIVALLKNSKLIKGIVGGGYQPANNFSLDDLDDQTREELEDANPNFMSLYTLAKKNNFSYTNGLVIERAKTVVDHYIGPMVNSTLKKEFPYLPEHGHFVIHEWDSALELADRHGDRFTKIVADYIEGNRYYDHGTDYASDDQISEFLEGLRDEALVKACIAHVKENYEDFNEDDENWFDFVVNHSVDEIMGPAKSAISDGYRNGAENQMYDAMKSTIEGYESETGVGRLFTKGMAPNEGIKNLHEPICFAISVADVVQLVRDANNNEAELMDEYGILGNGFFENEIKVEEPRYGWDEYDEKAAYENFPELLGDEIDIDPPTNESVQYIRKLAGLK